jgi:hypothetical protein
VLVATTSFTVDMHFCCNKLVDSSVFGKAKKCEEKVQIPDSNTKQCVISDTDCCSDQTFFKKRDENIKNVPFEFEKESIAFLNVFNPSYVNLFEGLEKNIVPFKQYRPPLLSKDIQVLHETFLI